MTPLHEIWGWPHHWQWAHKSTANPVAQTLTSMSNCPTSTSPSILSRQLLMMRRMAPLKELSSWQLQHQTQNPHWPWMTRLHGRPWNTARKVTRKRMFKQWNQCLWHPHHGTWLLPWNQIQIVQGCHTKQPQNKPRLWPKVHLSATWQHLWLQSKQVWTCWQTLALTVSALHLSVARLFIQTQASWLNVSL